MLSEKNRDDFRVRLKKSGLTVQMLADLARVPKSTIDNYIYGRTAEIKTPEHVQSIEEILDQYVDLAAAVSQQDNTMTVINVNLLVAEINARHAAEMDAVQKNYDERIERLKKDHALVVDELKKSLRSARRAFGVLLVVYIGQWVYDILNHNVGFVRDDIFALLFPRGHGNSMFG